MSKPTAPLPIDVSALSAEERDELRRQLGSEGQRVDAASEARVQHRQRALAGLIHPREHLRDCPSLIQDRPRVEAIAHVRPGDPKTGAPAEPVTVVRCLTCGGQTEDAIREPLATILARIDAQLSTTETD
jgi:hypothetical protein